MTQEPRKVNIFTQTIRDAGIDPDSLTPLGLVVVASDVDDDFYEAVDSLYPNLAASRPDVNVVYNAVLAWEWYATDDTTGWEITLTGDGYARRCGFVELPREQAIQKESPRPAPARQEASSGDSEEGRDAEAKLPEGYRFYRAPYVVGREFHQYATTPHTDRPFIPASGETAEAATAHLVDLCWEDHRRRSRLANALPPGYAFKREPIRREDEDCMGSYSARWQQFASTPDVGHPVIMAVGYSAQETTSALVKLCWDDHIHRSQPSEQRLATTLAAARKRGRFYDTELIDVVAILAGRPHADR